MGRKQLQPLPFTGDIPLGLARERWKSLPGKGVSPGRKWWHGGILEIRSGGGDAPSGWGKGQGTVKLVLERGGRLSATLQKLPVWVLATRASHGRGPTHSPAQQSHLALADLPECTWYNTCPSARAQKWPLPEHWLARPTVSKCHVNYAI